MAPSHSLAHNALQDLVLFVEVARTCSFSHAARALGLSAATLSRRIAQLETQAGVRLFNRTTRRVELTGHGSRLFERCSVLVEEAKLARDALLDEARQPVGLLRVSMPVDLGVAIVGPMLPPFTRRYPGLCLSLDLSPQFSDLLSDQVDVALRLAVAKDTRLVSRRIGWLGQGLFASPQYLKAHGTPQQPPDLAQHACIFIDQGAHSALWTLHKGSLRTAVKVTGRVACNNHSLLSALAQAGMGVAKLEPGLCRKAVESGALVPVLQDWTPPRLPVYGVTASRLKNAAVSAFLDHVAEHLPQLPGATPLR